MTASAKAVRFDDDSMWVHLDDGRVIAVPLAWFPRLLNANPEQRAQFELSPRSIHCEALDEDVSVDGLLAGHGDLTHGRLGSPAQWPVPASQSRSSGCSCHEGMARLHSRVRRGFEGSVPIVASALGQHLPTRRLGLGSDEAV